MEKSESIEKQKDLTSANQKFNNSAIQISDYNHKQLNMNTRHDDDYNFVFKIILLGDTNVGKTHLLSRYIKGQLPK